MNGPLRASFVVAVLSILAFSAAPAQAAKCAPCEAAHERCAVSCFGGAEAEIGKCLISCSNKAAMCSCDEEVTLSSEDFVAKLGSPVVTGAKAACHSTVPCGSEYGSCAGWSTWASCGDPRCARHVAGCGPCGPEDPCIGTGWEYKLERYRVCLNPQGQSCTQYQLTFVHGECDC
jgi:hypothetical protein